MNNYFVNKNKGVIILNLSIIFFIFRSSIPFMKYPFLIFYCISILILVSKKQNLLYKTKKFFQIQYISIILFLFFLISLFLSSKIFLLVFKDSLNILIIISFLFIIHLTSTGKKDLNHFFSKFIILTIYCAIFTTLYGLSEIFQLLPSDFSYSKSIHKIDYNFALIPGFLGVISILYSTLPNHKSKYIIVFYNIVIILFILNVFFSGSRRGMFLIVIIYAILLSKFFFQKKSSLNKKFLKSTIISLTFIPLLLFFVINHTSTSQKKQFLISIGTKDINQVQWKLAFNIHRIVSIFNENLNYYNVYDKLWTPIFNPYIPQSWGNPSCKTTYPLIGKGSEFIPHKAVGYLIDSTCKVKYYPSSNRVESLTKITELNVNINERYKISCFCFLSNEFDVNYTRITTGISAYNNKIIDTVGIAFYDYKNKNKWQKLEFEFVCKKSGRVPLYLSVVKSGKKDFSQLNGSVIFAYPQIEIIRDIQNLNYISNKNDLILFSNSDIKRNSELLIFNKKKISYAKFPLFSITSSIQFQKDSDLIRNLFKNFIMEDTTYYPFKANLDYNIKKEFGEDRLSRWKFAIEIFLKEYDWKQKLFGGGFNFLNWFGYVFAKDKTKTDYPHNPFLGILLYSGIIGLLLYLFLLYNVFKYYVKYRKEYPLLFIFFLIIYYFSFFSACHPFDPPMLGFFIMLPFLIHSINKNKEKDLLVES